MYSLFCEAKFWTFKNEVQIKNTDIGVLRLRPPITFLHHSDLVQALQKNLLYYLHVDYQCMLLFTCPETQIRANSFQYSSVYYDKREVDECLYLEGKKLYCNQRGTAFVLKNKRPLKLRDRLKELEQYLSNSKIVFYDWKNDNILHLILNTGLIIVIGVNVHNKDIYKILFDRFLIGKLLSENICDVLFTKSHLVISYNESQLTLVNFTKPLTKFYPPEKLAKLEPKVQHVDLCGPSGRRLDRKLSCNQSGDSILTWWHSTRNEVYPWSPLVKDEDRANVHIYSLIGPKIELLCFYRTEFDLINVNFSQIKPSVVWLIEQRVSKKGEVTVEYSSYEIVKNVFKKVSITSIPLQTQICCHSISPDEEKLVLGCIDGSLILFDEPRGVTRLVKSAFIPNLISWHNDGALIVIANERNQFQFFDLALSCVRIQLLSDDVTPSNLLDLACFFKNQPILLHIKWNRKENATYYMDRFIPNDHLLLLIFESGPLGVLTLIGGGGLSNDVQNSGLTPDTLIRQYLLWNQNDKALNVLLSLNWNTNGSACLAGLYHIANNVFRHHFTPESETQLESALGSFYAPLRPLTRFTENEFGNQIHDLTRRFFHLLLRHQLYEKAYCLAIDLSNIDLFLDLYHCAKVIEDEEMAFACRAKIEDLNCGSEDSSHSSCSRSSCSCSVSSDDEYPEGVLPPLPQVSVKKSKASRVPPLPDLNRHNKLRDSNFFNCNPVGVRPEVESNKSKELDIPSTSFNGCHVSSFHPLPKINDYNYSSTQILTPEFPHSYEIRTSFSAQEVSSNNYISNESSLRSSNKYSSLDNVIESLYDLPSNLKVAEQNIPTATRPDSSIGPLNLKSPQNHFRGPNAFSQLKVGFFDYLPPPGPRLDFREGKSLQITPPNLSSQFLVPRNSPYIPPPKQFNNIMLQRPLHFVPNPFPRPMFKPVNPSVAKQKVKFSDTVTHIVVPDFSKVSIEDETRNTQNKFRNNRNSKGSNMSPTASSNFQQNSGNAESNAEMISQQEHHDDEENNGAIKVIHFGVV